MTAPPAPTGSWTLERFTGGAAALHDESVPHDTRRTVWHLDLAHPALVLGSTQSIEIVNGPMVRAAGIDVVRRRSGGGAVLLRPSDTVWIDVIVSRDDPLWSDDVSRSFDWLGETWQRTLAVLGVESSIHREAPRRFGAGDAVCFGGLGPGEITVAGRKTVGLSQRRTRAHARFQCVLYTAAAHDLAEIVDLLREPADPLDREAVRAHLRTQVGFVAAPQSTVISMFVANLPG